MKRFLALLAIATSVSVIGAWVSTGAHGGWTKTQVMRLQVDPITEIEHPVWEEEVVLGIDFLIAGLAGSVLLAAPLLLSKCTLFQKSA
ncbi:MAG: hypothetical protein N2035_07430 [Chthoniobacterales bacterium]|nr:hypothetical protein [Chthoniobacterales bacterium]MCX7713477.1 hypothetical protein [Chthoniobacterales bacterium]